MRNALSQAPRRPFRVAECRFDSRRAVPDEEARLIASPHDDFEIARNALSAILQKSIVRQPVLEAGQGDSKPEAQRLLLDRVGEEVLQTLRRIVALEGFRMQLD
ncbi:MAG: hypothetical protein WA397_30305 [Roseiarcus sp.]